MANASQVQKGQKGRVMVSGRRRGWRLTRVLVAAAAALVAVPMSAAPASANPANDDVNRAVVVPSLPFHLKETVWGGSRAPDDPTDCWYYQLNELPTFWYRYTPSLDEDVLFDLTTTESSVYFALYTRQGGNWQKMRCINDSDEARRFTEPLSAGTTYYLAATTIHYENRIDIRMARPSTAGTSLSNAIPATLGRNTTDPRLAWVPPGDDPGCATLRYRVVFFRFDAAEDQGLSVTADPDADVNIYTNTPGGPPVPRDCEGYGEPIYFPLRAGQTAWIAIRFHSSIDRMGGFDLQQQPLNPYDNFANAKPIPANTVEHVDLRTASVEQNEVPVRCYKPPASGTDGYTNPGKSAWYRFELTERIGLEAQVSGGTIDVMRATSASQATCVWMPRGGTILDPGTYYVRGITNHAREYWWYDRPQQLDFSLETFAVPVNTRPQDAEPMVEGQWANPTQNRGVFSLWYRFTPSRTGIYELYATGSAYAATMHEGPTPGAVAQTGDLPRTVFHTQEQVSQLLARAGVTYYFATSDYRPFLVREVVPRPLNDFEWRPLDTPSVPFTHSSGEGQRTMSEAYVIDDGEYEFRRPEGPSCQRQSGGLRWFEFNPTTSGRAAADTTGSLYRTVVGVYDKTSGRAELACSAPTAFRPQARVAFNYVAGRRYSIVIGGNTSSSNPTQVETGRLELSVREVPTLANDARANAEVITALPSSSEVTAAVPTLEPGERGPSCGPAGEGTIWYRIDVPGNTGVVVETDVIEGSAPAIAVRAAHLGDKELACGVGRVAYRHDPSGTYFVQVAGEGRFRLRLAPVSPPANDDARSPVVVDRPRLETSQLSPWVDQRSTDGSGLQPTEPAASGQTATVWYLYQPTLPVMLQVDTAGSNFDARVTVYEQSGNDPARPVQGVDQNTGKVTFLALPGSNIYLQVWGGAGATGQLKLTVSGVV